MLPVSSLELLLVAVGLSMDAFAVSVCKGLAIKALTVGKTMLIGLWFGAFQALMPLLGYLLGARFAGYIAAIDHWIAFVLLFAIGAKMLWESFQPGEKGSADIGFAAMLPLAVATSIDAFAVGITFALLPAVNIGAAIAFIGVTTLCLSALAVQVGHRVGLHWGAAAERFGGVILICLGVKILIEHLFLL